MRPGGESAGTHVLQPPPRCCSQTLPPRAAHWGPDSSVQPACLRLGWQKTLVDPSGAAGPGRAARFIRAETPLSGLTPAGHPAWWRGFSLLGLAGRALMPAGADREPGGVARRGP